MMKSLDDLNGKVFREHLHTQFKVQVAGQTVPVELIEVAERDDSGRMEFFSLHFRGPLRPQLAQQIHRMEHDGIGTFELFLTPISADGHGTVYEAIFHRFRKQP